MVTDDAAPATFDRGANGEEIAVAAVQDKSQPLVSNTEEACGPGYAPAGFFESFADQVAFVAEDFGVQGEA